MDKISIIITTYKHQDYIIKAIESIQSQDYKNWEILIGDDSPDDLTEKLIINILDSNKEIKYWHHKQNKGIVDNINFLLSKVDSKSKYIAFLEGDDMYLPNNLSEKINIFKNNPDIKLVYNDMDFINREGKILIKDYLKYRGIPFFQNKKIETDIFIMQTTGPISSWSTCMIDKSILEFCNIRSCNTNKKNYQVSDYDFYFQVSTKYPVYGIEKSLTKYRRHENNLSGSNGGTSEDLEKLLKYYFENNTIKKYVYMAKMSWIQIVYSLFSLEIGDKRKGINYLIKSLKYNKLKYMTYKIFILIMFIIPASIGKKIIRKLIGRN